MDRRLPEEEPALEISYDICCMQHTLLSISLTLLFALPLKAQKDSIQRVINKEVWVPFIKAFNEGDTEAFLAVHSRDVSRVLDHTIWDYNEYAKHTRDGNVSMKKQKRTQQLELRFTRRVANGNRAYDVGYYKGTSTGADGKPRSYYGKFTVLLRKEEGAWKILMDQDSPEDASEATFRKAAPME